MCSWQAVEYHLGSSRATSRHNVPQLFDLLPSPQAICFKKSRVSSSSMSATETQQVAYVRNWPKTCDSDMFGRAMPKGNNMKLDEIYEYKT